MPDDRFPEPEPDDWEPPSLAEVYKLAFDFDNPTPLDVTPYKPVLTPLDIPPYVKPPDHTAPIHGWTPGTGAGPRDQLNKLTVAQEIDLLNKNNIYLSTKQLSPTDNSGFGAMSAYVVADRLKPAPSFTPVVRFKEVALRTPQEGRKENVAYSYNQFESNLQRQLVTEGNVEFGIPKVFKVNTDFGYGSSTAVRSNDTDIHFAANLWIPKAEVVFDERNITLEPSFVSAIKDIVDSGRALATKAEALLAHLAQFGQFVPLRRLVGGRMSLRQATTLKDWSTFDTVKVDFSLAAAARFKVNSVPGQAAIGIGVSHGTTISQSVINQAKLLKMEMSGGHESLADGNPESLGGQWVDSLGSYEEWRTYGFEEGSLVPILDFLPLGLSLQAWALLHAYFQRHLHIQNTGFAGHESTNVGNSFEEKKLKFANGKSWFGDKPADTEFAKFSSGLSEIVVNSEGNVDGLKLTYHLYSGLKSSGRDHEGDPRYIVYETENVSAQYGKNRGSSYDKKIKFSPGEVIRALEVWVDPSVDKGVVRSLAFRTSTGRRFPNDKGFYGANPTPPQINPKPGVYWFDVIEAPRVRVLHGYSGGFVHSVGLTYLDLDDDVKSREFLLAVEPFLFPTGDYGPLDL